MNKNKLSKVLYARQNFIHTENTGTGILFYFISSHGKIAKPLFKRYIYEANPLFKKVLENQFSIARDLEKI
jgi:hypothetical protein